MALHGDTLYVADTENHLLRKVDLKNQPVATIAGTGQEAARRRRNPAGPPLKTELNSPWALCIHGWRFVHRHGRRASDLEDAAR